MFIRSMRILKNSLWRGSYWIQWGSNRVSWGWNRVLLTSQTGFEQDIASPPPLPPRDPYRWTHWSVLVSSANCHYTCIHKTRCPRQLCTMGNIFIIPVYIKQDAPDNNVRWEILSLYLYTLNKMSQTTMYDGKYCHYTCIH